MLLNVLQSVEVKSPDADALAFWKSEDVAVKVGTAVAPVPLASTVFAPALPKAVVIAVAPEPVTAPVSVIVWLPLIGVKPNMDDEAAVCHTPPDPEYKTPWLIPLLVVVPNDVVRVLSADKFPPPCKG